MQEQEGIAEDRMQHRLVLALGVSFVLAAGCMFAGQSLAFSGCVSLILSLAAALGALKRGRLGPFKPFFAAALAVWLLAFGLMHGLPATAETLWLGLPPATAISVFVLWLAPLFLVTLPYALFFESHVLSGEDFDEVLRHAGERR